MLDPDEPGALAGFVRRRRQQWRYARTGGDGEFQRRVAGDVAERLVGAAGFTIEASWYHNLAAFKWLAKHVADDAEAEFTRFWVEVEARLNRDFSPVLAAPLRGDASALWQIALSRTLLLR